MKTIRLSALLLVSVVPLLAGCRDHVPPDAGQLREKFGLELPGYWQASAFHVEAQEVQGHARDRFRARFRATIELTAPTFVEDHRIGDTLFIRQAGARGLFRQVYGSAAGQLAAGDWATSFRMENDPTQGLGKPRDFFSAPRVIVVGSHEDQEFQARQRQAREQAAREIEAAQRAAQQSLEDAFVGEWHGTAFDDRNTRLLVTRTGSLLQAFFYQDDYVETLRVEMLAGGRYLLTGVDVAKLHGGKVNWNLDTFEVQVTEEGVMTGTVQDTRHSGTLSMLKVTSPGED